MLILFIYSRLRHNYSFANVYILGYYVYLNPHKSSVLSRFSGIMCTSIDVFFLLFLRPYLRPFLRPFVFFHFFKSFKRVFKRFSKRLFSAHLFSISLVYSLCKKNATGGVKSGFLVTFVPLSRLLPGMVKVNHRNQLHPAPLVKAKHKEIKHFVFLIKRAFLL